MARNNIHATVFTVTFAATACLFASTIAAQDPSVSVNEINWFYTYAEGMEAAKKQNKPVLIDFYADWCGPCRMLDEQVFPERNVIAAARDYVAVKVNVDQEDKVALAYHIRSIPRTMILNVHGEIVGDQIGFMDADEYTAFLNAAKEYAYKKVDGLMVHVPDENSAPAIKVNEDTAEDALWDYLAHKDPRVRDQARKQLLTRDEATVNRFLAHAQKADYIGLRLAAYETLVELGQTERAEAFDPWQSPKD